MKFIRILCIISCLLQSGCTMLFDQDEGVTPLMVAAKNGDTAEIKRLIADGAEVDEQSHYGWTALMFAAWQGNEDVVVALLEAGSDPNISSGTVPSAFETVAGHPPSSVLQEAIRNNHLSIAKKLLGAGAKLDARAVALAGGIGDVEFLAYLQAFGADWNLSSGNAFYATPLGAAASSGNLDAVRWLIDNGADPNVVAVGQTALKKAVDNDERDIVEYLLKHGADPNLVYGSTGESALFSAVTKYTHNRDYAANLAIIQMLLDHGADTNHRAFNGQHTALEFILIQKANAGKYLEEATPEESKDRHRASLAHKNAVIHILRDYQDELVSPER